MTDTVWQEMFWPTLNDIASTRKIARNNSYVSLGVGFVIGIIATASMYEKHPIMGLGPLALIDAGLFLVIGIGIARMSRVAAILGFVLYIIDTSLPVIRAFSEDSVSIWYIIFVLAFINAVRATFIYHRLKGSGA